MEMDVREINRDITEINLVGRLDVAGASKIDLQLRALANTRRQILVDLSGVTFIASTGIHLIVVSAKALKSKGGRLVLVGPNTEVMTVLETTGIDAMIPICPTRDAAVAALVS